MDKAFDRRINLVLHRPAADDLLLRSLSGGILQIDLLREQSIAAEFILSDVEWAALTQLLDHTKACPGSGHGQRPRAAATGSGYGQRRRALSNGSGRMRPVPPRAGL
jgi:hypothetical protein